MADHCAHCGLPLKPAPLGGTQWRCCSGGAYWSKRAPEPRDSWWPVIRLSPLRGGWYLYASAALPLGTRFIKPRHSENGGAERG